MCTSYSVVQLYSTFVDLSYEIHNYYESNCSGPEFPVIYDGWVVIVYIFWIYEYDYTGLTGMMI